MIAGLAALVFGVAFVSLSSATTAYSVKVTVKPTSLKLGRRFKATAKGYSANTSVLWMIINVTGKCDSTPKADSKSSAHTPVLKVDVTGAYTHSHSHASLHAGTHRVCAYLTALPPSSLIRGRASAAYVVR